MSFMKWKINFGSLWCLELRIFKLYTLTFPYIFLKWNFTGLPGEGPPLFPTFYESESFFRAFTAEGKGAKSVFCTKPPAFPYILWKWAFFPGLRPQRRKRAKCFFCMRTLSFPSIWEKWNFLGGPLQGAIVWQHRNHSMILSFRLRYGVKESAKVRYGTGEKSRFYLIGNRLTF